MERRIVGLTTGVQLRGPEGAQRLRATSAATAELCDGSHGRYLISSGNDDPICENSFSCIPMLIS